MNKQIWWIVILVAVLALIGMFNRGGVSQQAVTPSQATTTEEVCVKKDTGAQMSYLDARQIASTSACVSQGSLLENHWCNENSGTWWIDTDIQKVGCHPACVVDVESGQAEINWMCTGLIAP
jgi:hypothetical protein